MAMPDAAVVFMLPLRSGMIVLCTLEGSNWRSDQMELVFTCLQRERLRCAAGSRWVAMAWSSQVPIPPMLLCSWLIIVGKVLCGLLIFGSGLYWLRGLVLPVELLHIWQVCISQSIQNRTKIDLNIVRISNKIHIKNPLRSMQNRSEIVLWSHLGPR